MDHMINPFDRESDKDLLHKDNALTMLINSWIRFNLVDELDEKIQSIKKTYFRPFNLTLIHNDLSHWINRAVENHPDGKEIVKYFNVKVKIELYPHSDDIEIFFALYRFSFYEKKMMERINIYTNAAMPANRMYLGNLFGNMGH